MAARTIAKTLCLYLWVWSAGFATCGFGLGLAWVGVAPGGAMFVVGGLAILGSTIAVWSHVFCRPSTPPPPEKPDPRSAEEQLGAAVYDDATGDLPISFSLSEQGRAEFNRALIRLGITREQAVREAFGNFLRRYGREPPKRDVVG